MNITIGYITCPRAEDYLGKSVLSLENSDWDWEYLIYEDKNKELGAFKNYHRALTDLIEVANSDYILVSSDDIVFCHNWVWYAKQRMNENSVVALYVPKGMTAIQNIRQGWNLINEGWEKSYGGQYLMHKDTAKRIVEHPAWIDHYENYTANQQIDHILPEVCYQLEVDQWYSNPSLCNHIGYISELGHVHTGNEQGLNFKL